MFYPRREMKKVYFKDVEEGQPFEFGEDTYIKTSEDRGLFLGGSRIFNPMEVVSQ